jgi:Amt family ammonium transporter
MKGKLLGILRGALLIVCAAGSSAWAQAPSPVAPVANQGTTALLVISSALVLFMTLPGLAMFYGGLVRAKNFLSVLMHCFGIAAVVSVLWCIAGYSLAFGTGSQWIGGLGEVGLGQLHRLRAGLEVPENVFALYQMMFAIITPALIVGALPERVRFGWLMIFSALWLFLVYIPVAHWIWGGGWLAAHGVRDFAGGIVVHTTAGIAALVVAIMIGARRGFPATLIPPHSPAMTMIGAGMLWVGWFGFNGGSALAANAVAGDALLSTQLAASTAALTWALIERIKIGKATSVGLVTGAVAGLATITPSAGYVSPAGGLAIGAIGAAVCFVAVLTVKRRWRIDDSLDVFAVHGIGGITGSLLLAPFASLALGGDGLNTGAMPWSVPGGAIVEQLGMQAFALVIVILWSAGLTYVIARAAAMLVPMRVDDQAEHDGLDLSFHGERAYEFD